MVGKSEPLGETETIAGSTFGEGEEKARGVASNFVLFVALGIEIATGENIGRSWIGHFFHDGDFDKLSSSCTRAF